MLDFNAIANANLAVNPWQHVALDNIWDHAFLDRVLAEFGSDRSHWDVRADMGVQVKNRSNWQSWGDLGPNMQQAVAHMNSGDMLKALTKLTGIEGLISDPYLTGGGLNEIVRGGHLAVHVDGTFHHVMKLHRRLNVITYLNHDWREEWGGAFELWNQEQNEPKELVKRIYPDFNKTIVFVTNDYSWHGHPTPLACPEGRGRRSLIMYYYTVDRPITDRWDGDTQKHHSAIFRPGVGVSAPAAVNS